MLASRFRHLIVKFHISIPITVLFFQVNSRALLQALLGTLGVVPDAFASVCVLVDKLEKVRLLPNHIYVHHQKHMYGLIRYVKTCC